MGTGDLCHRRPVQGAPQQRYATGEPGKAQGQDHVGIVGENSFYRESRGKRLDIP